MTKQLKHQRDTLIDNTEQIEEEDDYSIAYFPLLLRGDCSQSGEYKFHE